jgi:hypothetical protein
MSLGRINKNYVWIAIGLFLVLPLFYLDTTPKENIELRKGIEVVRYMSAPRQLKRSRFQLTFPSGTSEQFLDWMFSPFGASEWPPYESGVEFGPEGEAMIRKTGVPFIPANLVLIPQEPDLEKGRQVAIRAELDRATQLPSYLEINWTGKGEYEVKKMIEKKSKRKRTKKKT